jgi:diguanylate cyclase (GGDEF)-like protein/PAS domain S-box-containing protein
MLEHSEVISTVLLTKSYNTPLVIFSIMIAIFSSLTAFSSAERCFSATQINHKIAWNLFGATSMGLGIWSMHFIGMLALNLPIPVKYDPLVTFISIIPAICACSVVLWIMTKETISPRYLLLSGVLLGSGIGLMHYKGMAAMRLNATMIHDSGLFYLSIIAAVALATVALTLQGGRLRQANTLFFNKRQFLSALAMGSATSGMHYTAMSAVNFAENNSLETITGINSDTLIIMVSLSVFLILVLAILLPRLNFFKDSADKTEVRYGSIFENSLTEIFIFSADDYLFLNVNHGACQNIGYSQEELSKITPLDIKPMMSLEQFNDLVEPLRSGSKDIIKFETTHQRKNGTLYFVEVHLQITNFLSKLAFVAIILDITERKNADKKLQLSSRVLSNIHEGIMITDANQLIIDVNPAFCKITGYSPEDVIGKKPEILRSNVHSPEFYEKKWKQLDAEGFWQSEQWKRKKSGVLYAELLTISTLRDNAGSIVNYVSVFTDITVSKQQQEQLSQMAHYDKLTGLPNRALFVDRFNLAIAHSKRTGNQLAVCFLDLDHFKSINDHYGHDKGDLVLIEVAERLQKSIREEDTLSRQGGDEFALLLNDITSLVEVEQTLERIHQSLVQPYVIDNNSHTITLSTGVTLYPKDLGDIDTLLRHADNAMYQAKQAGRNRYHFFNTAQDQEIILRHHRLDEIMRALSNKEFELYYQPKINMLTGQVIGAEALIRWIHPEKGLIPPLDFLPIVEGTELEIQVGNWVIDQAVKQLELWHSQNVTLEVSVNISSHHILSVNFTASLETILAKYSLVHSQYLQLEILESSALGDLDTISSIIRTCQDEIGVSVALDGFGTGYPPLTHLRELPSNTIKIDQTFVRDMLDDPGDCAIIKGVIGISDSFNRNIIAEGVETVEHGLMLILLGCYQVQGYGISRPMPASEIPNWISNYKPNRKWMKSANKQRTDSQRKVELFKLISDQWRDQFVTSILAKSEGNHAWPIMDSQQCSCGNWLSGVRQKKFFADTELTLLEQAHQDVHLIANEIQLKYSRSDIEADQTAFADFNLAFDKMGKALAQCLQKN